MLDFFKMQATGNDFVIINFIDNFFEYDMNIFAEYICNRHYGIGADGLILFEKSEIADYKMRIFNSDGSEAEMCGNGIRCLGKYLYENEFVNKDKFCVETKSGIKDIEIQFEGEKISNIKVKMGKCNIKTINYIIEINESNYQVFSVDIGNPHAICFCKDVDMIDLKEIGPVIENYKYFVNKTNVEFVEIIDKENIKVRVWERGVGETNSCGTGACACAMVSSEKNLVNNNVNVNLRGGKLNVEYDEKTKVVYLTGEAENVFKGMLNL